MLAGLWWLIAVSPLFYSWMVTGSKVNVTNLACPVFTSPPLLRTDVAFFNANQTQFIQMHSHSIIGIILPLLGSLHPFLLTLFGSLCYQRLFVALVHLTVLQYLLDRTAVSTAHSIHIVLYNNVVLTACSICTTIGALFRSFIQFNSEPFQSVPFGV
jgi:hypothetical protein